MAKVYEWPKRPVVVHQVRNCTTCAHFNAQRYNPRCMLYPEANFHQVTTRACSPGNDKALWQPRPRRDGWLKRLLRWVW